jgi:excisionase family DNA binding protein
LSNAIEPVKALLDALRSKETIRAMDAKMVEKQSYSIPEAARLLGIGLKQARDAVRNRQIPSIKINDRDRIPKPALDRLLNNGAAASEAASD